MTSERIRGIEEQSRETVTQGSTPPRSAYIHVPFCRHRCGYCNFTLVANRDDLVEPYLMALERELSWLEVPRNVHTVYVGGGTPSHLSPQQISRLLEIIRRWFVTAPEAEFTMEANPLDVTPEKVRLMADAGVNRLSLGIQSFQNAKLSALDRDHDADQSRQCIDIARGRFENLSIDLIFAAPGESRETWESDVRQCMRLHVPHVSTYGLTYERGTSFWSQSRRGAIRPTEESVERWMYEFAMDTLVSGGFEHYEVSSFARPGFRSAHNLIYWNGGEYYAAGPGAARHLAGRRETNHRSTTTYLRRVLANRSPVAESESLDPPSRALERLVFGLRQIEGIRRDQFQLATGYRLEDLVQDQLTELQSLGLVELTDTVLKLTREGLLLSDAIMTQFLSRPVSTEKIEDPRRTAG